MQNDHLLKRFDEELKKLRFRLLKMSTFVQQQVDTASRALLENNPEMAKEVISLELKVDDLDLKIDKQCIRIFALHQPVAMDLRLVLSAVSMNELLEMIGDQAASIAETLLRIQIKPGIINKTKFPELSANVNEVIKKVMDSFILMNIDYAIDALKQHEKTRDIFEENFEVISTFMKEDTTFIDTGSRLIDINRNIRTISRLAKSLGEELFFLVEAKLIKHKNLDDIVFEEDEDNIK